MTLFRAIVVLSVISVFHHECFCSDVDNFKAVLTKHGQFELKVNDEPWLKSGPVWITVGSKVYSTEDGTLKYIKSAPDYGFDNLGAWNRTTYFFLADKLQYATEYVAYQHIPLILFGQYYLEDTHGTSQKDVKKTVAGWPSFQVPDSKSTSSKDLGFFYPSGYQGGFDEKASGRWNKEGFNLVNGHKVGPLSWFDGKGNTVVMSPFANYFMASSTWYDKPSGLLNVGLLGKIDFVPKGSEWWTMLSYSSKGIQNAFEVWAKRLRGFNGAKTRDIAKRDFTNNHLGYYTDNGAVYYYNTEDNKTYQDTILDIKQNADENGIPYRYIQYDSWFYPKKPEAYGGLMEWVGNKTEFPDGMNYVFAKTGWPVASHCRYWSPDTPMAKQNGGKYSFHIESKMSVPTDPQFFPDIMRVSRSWGNIMFEQDWLAQMFENLDIFQSDLAFGAAYMNQMNNGAKENGLTINLCTAYPRHILQAVVMPQVTSARVSDDYYGDSSDQWKIGITSLWVSAIGLQPYKDTFWSSPKQNTINPKYPDRTEAYVELQSLVSSLSAGPIAPSDAINMANRTLIMRCCNENGLILKPDRPSVAIDLQFYQLAFQDGSGPSGEVWTTSTEFPLSKLFFGIIFAVLDKDFKLGLSSSFGEYFPKVYKSDYVVYSYRNPEKQVPFSDDKPMALTQCTKKDFCLYYTSPVLTSGSHKVVMLGEKDKWIPFSSNRITQIDNGNADIFVYLTGAINEMVYFHVSIDNKYIIHKCNLGDNGMKALSILTGVCV